MASKKRHIGNLYFLTEKAEVQHSAGVRSYTNIPKGFKLRSVDPELTLSLNTLEMTDDEAHRELRDITQCELEEQNGYLNFRSVNTRVRQVVDKLGVEDAFSDFRENHGIDTKIFPDVRAHYRQLLEQEQAQDNPSTGRIDR